MAMDTMKIENKFDREKRIELEKPTEGAVKQINFDELLIAAGEFSIYQILLFFATSPFFLFGVFVYYSQMFITEPSPNHWCWVPELANLSDTERRTLAIPIDDSTKFGYSHCQVYDANWDEVLITGQLPNSTWPIKACEHGWEFNKTEIPYPTITSEMDWICDRGSYQATAQALFFVGSIIGGFLIGWVADWYGRLPAAVYSTLIGCLGGILTTFARNFTEFSIYRFIAGMAYDNCMMMAYLILLEYVTPKYKTMVANMAFALFYTSFTIAMPWISLACGHWKTISIVTSAPLLLAVLAPCCIPESPRWLLSMGRVDEAINKILTISRINNKEIPPKIIEQFKCTVSKETKEESHSCLEIFKRPPIRRTFILMCLEFTCCTIIFDALVRSTGQLGFDFFISFSVISFTELPSMCVVAFIMDWMGRKWMTISCMMLCSVFTLLTVFVGSGVPSVMCTVLARFFVNISYNATMQWTAEVLPTQVRGSGASVVHICGYIGTALSPYIVYLQIYISWLPFVIIAAIAAFGAFIAFALPETTKKDIPQTFNDAEELSRNINLWEMPCLSRPKNIVSGHENESFEM